MIETTFTTRYLLDDALLIKKQDRYLSDTWIKTLETMYKILLPVWDKGDKVAVLMERGIDGEGTSFVQVRAFINSVTYAHLNVEQAWYEGFMRGFKEANQLKSMIGTTC